MSEDFKCWGIPWHGRTCRNRAKFNRQGVWYCGSHDPVSLAKRYGWREGRKRETLGSLKHEIISLRAALAAERAACTLRPMSEAKHREECVLRTRTGHWILGMVDTIDKEVIYDGMNSPIEFAVGFFHLPETIEPTTPDTEHSHD